MNETGARFLPIGTVVLLNGATKKVMITGFASISPETGDKVFDYSGCLYPEGFYSYNEVCVFYHNQIQEVFHLGFDSEEEKKFKEDLKNKIAELANNNHE